MLLAWMHTVAGLLQMCIMLPTSFIEWTSR